MLEGYSSAFIRNVLCSLAGSRFDTLLVKTKYINEPISKRPSFDQFLCQAKIVILEILNVFLRLKFSPFLTLNKLKRFETGSND
jgi:hypothetical protein